MEQTTANVHMVIAAYAQAALLVASAALGLLYLRSTIRIERAAIRQAQVAADQLEAQSRPVLVMREAAGTLELANIGTGPALEVAWWWWPEANVNPPWPGAPVDRAIYISPQQNHILRWKTPEQLNQGREVVFCRYKSVAGTEYISIGRRTGSEGTGGHWCSTEFRDTTNAAAPT
jgi:hypothetical protein